MAEAAQPVAASANTAWTPATNADQSFPLAHTETAEAPNPSTDHSFRTAEAEAAEAPTTNGDHSPRIAEARMTKASTTNGDHTSRMAEAETTEVATTNGDHSPRKAETKATTSLVTSVDHSSRMAEAAAAHARWEKAEYEEGRIVAANWHAELMEAGAEAYKAEKRARRSLIDAKARVRLAENEAEARTAQGEVDTFAAELEAALAGVAKEEARQDRSRNFRVAQARVAAVLRPESAGLWILGDRLRLSLHATRATGLCSWQADGEGSWYVLSDLASSVPEEPFVEKHRALEPVYLAGDHSVWDLGTAFLKVGKTSSPYTTREHVTLEYVRQKNPSFPIPHVLYHGEWDGYYFLLVTRVPGRTLITVWFGMTEEEKDACANRIVEICEELAEWRGDKISGVDGGQLCDLRLLKTDEYPKEEISEAFFSHETYRENCEELGMDCSVLMFYHCDLGPVNILYDNGRLSIIDWEIAGFVPKEWIATNFCASCGMSLDCNNGEENVFEYSRLMSAKFEEKGYPDIFACWRDWSASNT